MNSVLAKMHEIRDTVNKPWHQSLLLKNRKKWLQLCACMDVIEDTQQAIDTYGVLPDSSFKYGGYLYLYGLLQALFMQQDAIKHLTAILMNKEIDWKIIDSNIYNIRELRNNAVGHPTARGVQKNKSFHFIPRISISKSSFDIMSYAERDNFQNNIKNNNIGDIIQKQQNKISEILDNILTCLKQKLKAHKMNFQKDKIIDKIPAQYRYYLEKIGEGISSKDSVAKASLSTLKPYISGIKIAIIERYGSIEALPGLELEINDIEYILHRFDEWLNGEQLFENKDAGIFLYALSKKFDLLKDFLEEIDKEFSALDR